MTQQVTSSYLLPWRTAFQPSFAVGSRYAPSDCPSSSLAFTLIHNISSCRSVVGRWLSQLTTFPICYTPRQVSHQDKLGDNSAALLRRLYFYTAALPKAESYINPHDRYWDYLPLTGAPKSDRLLTIARGSSAAKAGVLKQNTHNTSAMYVAKALCSALPNFAGQLFSFL